MLDINFIRDNVEKVKKATAAKIVDSSIVDVFIETDKKRREELRTSRTCARKETSSQKTILMRKENKS